MGQQPTISPIGERRIVVAFTWETCRLSVIKSGAFAFARAWTELCICQYPHDEWEGQAMATHSGECFCGAVKVEVSGDPEGMGYCHCRSCRSWSGGPVNAFTLWKPDAVRMTVGAEHVGKRLDFSVERRNWLTPTQRSLRASPTRRRMVRPRTCVT
jgi:hypothetical protein